MKNGDLIEVITNSGKIIGRLMPSNNDVLILKLKNGYNIGINKEEVKGKTIVETYKEGRLEKKKVKEKKGLKNISILLTGGTISSAVDYKTGAVIAKFSSEELIGMFPRLRDIANINSRLIRNMWSDDLRFKHFEIIARAIEKESKKADGIIIGMGSDNLAVASAALSFIIEESNIPVILVGAQRSSDRGSSDAGMNLICAAKFIVNSDFKGAAICMHKDMGDEDCLILPSCKTAKLHTSRRDAFKAVNGSAIAKVSYKEDKIIFLDNYSSKGDRFIIKPKMEEKVGLLKIHVNMNAKQFEFFKGYKGLVLEGTGLGHMPLDVIDEYTKEHGNIKAAIKRLVKEGCVIVMCSSCIYGRVNMNVYSKGRDLMEIGIIPGEDMLANTAFIKLSWLLGNYKKEKVKELIKENLRGEISERILE